MALGRVRSIQDRRAPWVNIGSGQAGNIAARLSATPFPEAFGMVAIIAKRLPVRIVVRSAHEKWDAVVDLGGGFEPTDFEAQSA